MFVSLCFAALLASVFGDQCTEHVHPTFGKVGKCIPKSCCHYQTYISSLCPGDDQACCFKDNTCGGSSGSGGGISDACLHAICEVESGCRPLGCSFDVNGDACGYYQIHKAYYGDCGSPGSGWESCSKDKACATQCVKKYLSRYGTFCTGGRAPTCQDYARIHNGGPKGCVHSNTLGYWGRVNAQLGK